MEERRLAVLDARDGIDIKFSYLPRAACTVDRYQRFIDSLLTDDIGIEKYFTYSVTKIVKSMPEWE